MLIKSLYLKNIRSYVEQEFFFKKGMTLLSGDIGSGKSSVLLGIEFALFGLIRGSINGSSLLRHGAKEGLVSLSFSIGSDVFVVERGLKKTSNGIIQDKCSFSLNGSRTNLAPVELKSKILSLLGYPDDLVSKSKSLIFRYTVYTPQEEMKHILFDSKDDRLEKLRRIFGVDKYELVKNNASIYARDLRSETKAYSSVEEDVFNLKDKVKALKTELNLFFEERDSLSSERDEILKKEKAVGDELKLLEDDINNFNKVKSSKEVLLKDISSIKSSLKDLSSRIASIKESIESKEKSLKDIPKADKSSDDIKKDLLDVNSKLDDLAEKINKANSKKAVINSKISSINDLLKDIEELDTCPTCLQNVSSKHKEDLRLSEKKKLDALNKKLVVLNDYIDKARHNKDKLSKKRELLEKESERVKSLELKTRLARQSLDFISERKADLKSFEETYRKREVELKEKEEELVVVDKKIASFKDLNDKISHTKQKSLEVNNSLRAVEKKLSATSQAIKDKKSALLEKEEELKVKEKDLSQLLDKKILENWLSNHFINLMGIIEKHVLSRLHREFNSLFREWFDVLVEDSELEASVDLDFSPIISQNGYDSSVENLSGGEKTAISLAYRLALNKVINDLVHDVKTKGVLILDEPTDGFSSDQLDKVRDVLEKSNAEQVLIVSHEAKLESFVQNVIRVNKNNHESEVLQF